MATKLPVYLFTGFLEGGKTHIIQESMEDQKFNSGEKTLIIQCEEGIDEFDLSRFYGKNVYLETMSPSEQVQLAVELLEPVKDKILGAVGGNHERRSLRAVDLDPLFIVFCRLGIESVYRQNFEFLRIVLEDNGSRCDYSLMLLHGKTEGKRKQFDYAVEGVDAIIGAHTHMPNVSKNGKLVFTTKNSVKVQPFVSVTAPSFLRFGGYAAANLYKPRAASCPQYLLLEYKRGNKRDESITVVW